MQNPIKTLSTFLGLTRPLGEWETKGPPEDEHPPVPLSSLTLATTHRTTFVPTSPQTSRGSGFTSGWWSEAKRTPAHTARIGPSITPQGLVVHTTDTYPGGFQAIVKSWTTTSGKGNAATWMIGRTPEDGVVQFAPTVRNSNHAGGPNHGGFLVPGAQYPIHPNTCTVGVELDAAGFLVGKGGKFFHPDTKKEIPYEDVYIDSKGRPWHSITAYQMSTLKALWQDLFPTLKPFPAGTKLSTDATYESQGVPWAMPRYVNLVAHASLNPRQKTDPGPQVMEWMNS